MGTAASISCTLGSGGSHFFKFRRLCSLDVVVRSEVLISQTNSQQTPIDRSSNKGEDILSER